jgi:carboxymethylenebutenolidase
MTDKHIDTYISLASPWTHLGWERLHAIARRHGAGIAYFPIDTGVVFPATGGLPLPRRSPERRAYRLAELARWKAYLGAEDFNIEPKHFPVPPDQAGQMAIAAREQGADIGGLCRAILRAVWCEERDVADRETLVAIAAAEGFDGAALLAAGDDPAMAERYRADSEAAIARGVFGAPTYVVGDQLFWGQDRLDFVDRLLAAD